MTRITLRRTLTAAVAVTLVTIASACAGRVRSFHPNEALVMSRGIVIEGLGPKPIGEGEVFTPPFYARYLYHSPRAKYTDQLAAFQTIGRRVRVRVPGRDQPLYGLITFHQLLEGASGPATRSYAISIPQNYIDQASGGRVSVVYEVVPWREGMSLLGWVLFLSDRPI